MHLVTRKRQRWGRTIGPAGTSGAGARLPSFIRPLGLDVIITPEQRALLVELQHGFGRRGLIQLFPEIARAYRKTLWQLRRERGRSEAVSDGMRRICADKIVTYQHFADMQPASLPYARWDERARRWLEQLDAELVLAKPPRGSCGEGILVLERRALLSRQITLQPPSPMLLQAFVPSRPLAGPDGAAHLGCIRHIVLVQSDGERVVVLHTRPYWRVSPAPWTAAPGREAFTANISRGAFPLPVAPGDGERVRELTHAVVRRLLAAIFEVPDVPLGPMLEIGA